MTIIRRNGKVTTTTRANKRDRRHARKRNERQNNRITPTQGPPILSNLSTNEHIP